MNNTNNTLAAGIIQEAYEGHVYTLGIFSSTTLVFYATLTTFSREQEYIWFRPFSLPSLLYIFARYGILINQGLSISLDFISPGRSCDILAIVQNTIFILPYIGVQGLLVIRAYSICEGNKILISVLVFGFFSYVGVALYGTIAFPGCIPSTCMYGSCSLVISVWFILNLHVSAKLVLVDLIGDIIAVSTDLLMFGIFMWNVWSIWRLKHNNGIRSNSSLISVLLTQSILRCCFIITIAVANVPITWLQSSFVSQSYTLIQDALSVTLMTDFTLDLRNLNSARIEASQISLPPLRFSNVLQHVHQSLLVEMATPAKERHMEENHDNLPGATDDIQAAEV